MNNTTSPPVRHTSYETIPGWFNYQALYDDAVSRMKNGDIAVEVGCWMGKSTVYMAQRIKESGKKISFHAIDHGFGSPEGIEWKEHHEPTVLQHGGNIAGAFLTNLRDCGVLDYVIPLCMTSKMAAETLFGNETVDFCFIDGAHDTKSVELDLNLWWSRLRIDGTIAGHDYDGCWLGVAYAVDRFFGVPKPNPGSPITDFPLEDPHSKGCWSRQKVYVAASDSPNFRMVSHRAKTLR